MSVVLAIDTATDLGSVALGRPGEWLAEMHIGNRRHAAALLPAVTELLRVAGLAFADVARVALADGPGSFTGLRIGAATVQGIVRAHPHLSVATAPSLLATAWTASRFHDGPVAALYDALRGQVFAAVYRFAAGGVEALVSPTLSDMATLMADARLRPVVAVGTGAAAHADAVRRWTGRDPVGPPAGTPRAAALIELWGVTNAVRPLDDVAGFEPDYGRPAEAQVRWERSHGTSLPRP